MFCTDAFKTFKYPTFVIFKQSGGYEIHYGKTIHIFKCIKFIYNLIYTGRHTAHDLASFVRDCAFTNVQSLGPDLFPNKVVYDGQLWFVDFFAPVNFNWLINQ